MTETLIKPCTLEDVIVYLEGSAAVDNVGRPVLTDLGRCYDIAESCPYWCNGCEQEFEDWNAVRLHLGLECTHPYAMDGKCWDCRQDVPRTHIDSANVISPISRLARRT